MKTTFIFTIILRTYVPALLLSDNARKFTPYRTMFALRPTKPATQLVSNASSFRPRFGSGFCSGFGFGIRSIRSLTLLGSSRLTAAAAPAILGLLSVIWTPVTMTMARSINLIGIASTFAMVELIPTSSFAKTYFSTKQLLADQFAQADRVSYIRLSLDPQRKQQIEKKLGYRLPQEGYTFYVARKNKRPIGFALFDEDKGQHEMISLATFFDASGTISRVEIVAYREPYGDGVREARFRRQFVGKNLTNPLTADRDIDVISGATISSHAVARAVKRAAILIEDAKTEAMAVVQR